MKHPVIALSIALGLAGCHPRPKPPIPVSPKSIAYRIVRADGARLIVAYAGARTLPQLRDEFCREQTCLIETIRLKEEPQP